MRDPGWVLRARRPLPRRAPANVARSDRCSGLTTQQVSPAARCASAFASPRHGDKRDVALRRPDPHQQPCASGQCVLALSPVAAMERNESRVSRWR